MEERCRDSPALRFLELQTKRTNQRVRNYYLSPLRRLLLVLTLRRGEEVKEGVVGDGFGNGPHCATALVLLFLFDCFQRDVLPLRPVDRASGQKAGTSQDAATEASHRSRFSERAPHPVQLMISGPSKENGSLSSGSDLIL